MDEEKASPIKWNVLHPWHPDNRAAEQRRATQLVTDLVKVYGAEQAKLIWAEAAKAIPTRRGRPKGARGKESNFDPWRALYCLHEFAHSPGNMDKTRWRVIRMAAEFIADWGGGGALPKGLPAYPREQVASASGIKIAQSKERKAVVERLHTRLTREQDRVDANRRVEYAYLEELYGNGPKSLASLMTADERIQKLATERENVERQWPALPQRAEPTHTKRIKNPID